MADIWKNINVLGVIFKFLQLNDILRCSVVNKRFKTSCESDNIWWPLFHLEFQHVRIMDKQIGTRALGAYAACKRVLGGKKTPEAEVNFSMVILGLLGEVPVAPHLLHHYGQTYSLLGCFSQYFIYKSKFHSISALSIPSLGYLSMASKDTHAYLVLVDSKKENWEVDLDESWQKLKSMSITNIVILVSSEEPLEMQQFEEMTGLGVKVLQISTLDDKTITTVFHDLLDTCQAEDELIAKYTYPERLEHKNEIISGQNEQSSGRKCCIM